jgi:putative FmdB family regulatory protein
MPIYEYNCSKCGDFETTQKITDPPLQKCPTCRRKVTKLISATSFQLKGSGWYVTDYGKSGSGTSSKKSDSGSDTATSTETKPPAKESKASSKDTKAA